MKKVIFRNQIVKDEPEVLMEIIGPKGHCKLYCDKSRLNDYQRQCKQAKAIKSFMEFNNENICK